MYRIYISSSTQAENVGVGQYGTEQDRMMQLSDRVKYWLETQKRFTVFRNQPGWSLKQTVDECNNLACDIFIDNHTNAGPIERKAGDGGAEGTEVFYHHQGGMTSNSYRLASAIYSEIAPISPGKDRGILPDNSYVGSLYVIQKTKPTAVLIEHIFHTNYQEVEDMLLNMDKYAKAEAKAICKFFSERWEEPQSKEQNVGLLIDKMYKDGIITDIPYWTKVFMGKIVVSSENLQIAFGRAVNKR